MSNKSEKFRKPLKRLLSAILVLVAVLILRFVFGMGTAAWHYWSTPKFHEYLATHPVDTDTINERIPQGKLISSEDRSTAGTVDPLTVSNSASDYICAELLLEIEILRGDEQLLECHERFSVALRKNDWTHHGIDIHIPTLRTAPGLQAIVVTSLSDPDKMLGEDSARVGNAMVDVFLISNQGPSKTQFRLHPEEPASLASFAPRPTSPISLWQRIAGLPYNTKSLPEEGLIHHTRQRVRFDWERFEKGYGGPSMSYATHATNTHEYSYDLNIKISEYKSHRDSDSPESTFTQSQELSRRWMGKIW